MCDMHTVIFCIHFNERQFHIVGEFEIIYFYKLLV